MTEQQTKEALVSASAIPSTDQEQSITQVEAPVSEAPIDDGRERQYPCRQCGASLKWEPGAAALACPYCGHQEDLPQDEKSISEYPFNDYVNAQGKQSGLGLASRSVSCRSCAAAIELAADQAATVCPFCGSNAIDEAAYTDRIQPEAIIPFAQDAEQARAVFRQWLKRRWFAPNNLCAMVQADAFQGVYRPWWTFDSHTMNHWSGEAGTYYYVTRSRSVNGKTETYRERRTRWTQRSGTFEQFFDDELCKGFAADLAATDYQLSGLKPYDPSMIAGFLSERYVLDPQAAWPTARSAIEAVLRQGSSERLGGDTQRGLQVQTAHSGITFKSLLLPAWHSAYHYKAKVYQIIVNGQNGSINAQRPYSWIKISLAVVAGLAVIAAIVVLLMMQS